MYTVPMCDANKPLPILYSAFSRKTPANQIFSLPVASSSYEEWFGFRAPSG